MDLRHLWCKLADVHRTGDISTTSREQVSEHAVGGLNIALGMPTGTSQTQLHRILWGCPRDVVGKFMDYGLGSGAHRRLGLGAYAKSEVAVEVEVFSYAARVGIAELRTACGASSEARVGTGQPEHSPFGFAIPFLRGVDRRVNRESVSVCR